MRQSTSLAASERERSTCLAIRAADYSPAAMASAAAEALALWPLTKPLVGKTVLLKVNALSPKEPTAGVTTHPALVRAVAEELKIRGASVWIGDSSGGIVPGGSRTAQALRTTGMVAVAEEVGAELLNFDKQKAVAVDNPRGTEHPQIVLSQKTLEADYVISLAKLKTHSYTLYTGGIKNLYGCIPGGRKAAYHGMAPTVEVFSEFIVDVFELIQPDLTIIDAVMAMEGAGPAAGDLRLVGAIFASVDATALDASCCRLMGIKPEHVSMLRIAAKRGLGTITADQIEEVGVWQELQGKPFKGRKRELPIPQALRGAAAYALKARPEIVQDRCIRCRICLHSCPVATIVQQENGAIMVEPEKCIQCYCCHELCPEDAIAIRTSVLGRLLQWAARAR